MDFKFSKDSSESQHQEVPETKKTQSALLVLLLILVGGFTYIYFFTSLIKPQETTKNQEAAKPVEKKVEKIPLPPHDGETAKTDTNSPVKPASAVLPAQPAAKPAMPPAKQVAAAPVKAAVPPPKVMPSPTKSAPVKEDSKKVAAKPINKKTSPATVAKVEEKKSSVVVKKVAETDQKIISVKKTVKKPVTENQVKSKIKASEPCSLLVGNYVLEEALSVDLGRVRKAGFQPIIKASTRKKSGMNRLVVAEFADRTSALPTLDKLKKHTSDAFVIQQGNKFAVVAGSYLQAEAAATEKNRLKAAGFDITIKRIEIAIPSQIISVGPFANKKAADAALAKLKTAGIKASLSQN